MKHVSLLLLVTIFSFGAIKAQNEMDAYKFSKNDLSGTARSVSMGGAFGALGGDISGVAINPAGIGVYSSHEVVTTLNFQNTTTQTQMLRSNKLEENKFKVNFDNLAIVGSFPLFNDVAPYLNVGFSYNKLKNFDRKYQTRSGDYLNRAMSDYMASRATWKGVDKSYLGLKGTNTSEMYDVWDNEDWLSVLGYNSFLINESSSGIYNSPTNTLAALNNLFVEEKGMVSSYDFNIGTTFSDIISIGTTISLTDIRYDLYSKYTEDYFGDKNGATHSGGYDLYNRASTDGTGWQVKAGVIIKPIQALRIGFAYHSPTWYKMTDRFSAELDHNLNDLANNLPTPIDPSYGEDVIQSYDGLESGIFDYEMRTPDKWVASIAGVISNKAIISADYELTNYKNNMKLFDKNGRSFTSADPNEYIKQDFRNASTVRVGLEYRFTDKFSGRVGYSWVESPFTTKVKTSGDDVTDDGRPVTHFIFDNDTQYFTYGLGYRFSKNFYTDVAFVMKEQKGDLYAFTGADKATFKSNTFQGMLTLGYKFR